MPHVEESPRGLNALTLSEGTIFITRPSPPPRTRSGHRIWSHRVQKLPTLKKPTKYEELADLPQNSLSSLPMSNQTCIFAYFTEVCPGFLVSASIKLDFSLPQTLRCLLEFLEPREPGPVLEIALLWREYYRL